MSPTYTIGPDGHPIGNRSARPPGGGLGPSITSAVLRILIGALAIGWPDFAVRLVVTYGAIIALLLAGAAFAFAWAVRRGPGLAGPPAVLGAIAGILGLVALLRPESVAYALLALFAFILLLQGVYQLTVGLQLSRLGQGMRLVIAGLLTGIVATVILLRPDQGLDALVVVLGILAVATGIGRLLTLWRQRGD